MEILKYITAVTRYYKLKLRTIKMGNNSAKEINVLQISGKISFTNIVIWIIMSMFFTICAMGTDTRNIITVNNGHLNITYNKYWWVYLVVAVAIMIVTIVKSVLLFRKLEHKPPNLNIYQREKPSNLRPAHVRILLNDGLVDEVSLAATLLDLIDRGYLSVERYEYAKEKIFDNKEMILRKTEKKTDDLLKFEKFIIEWFINKYGDGKQISMQEIENRLKNNIDTEKPSDLFEYWLGLVFLSFPLKKLYKEYRRNNKAYMVYVILSILGIIPIVPCIRNFRHIRIGVHIICLSIVSTK